MSEFKNQAPEQGAVAWQVTGAGGLTVTPQYPSWAEGDASLNIQPLYAHPSAEIERLRADNKRLTHDFCQTDHAFVACINERDELRQKLAEAQALLRDISTRPDNPKIVKNWIDAFLSATDQPAEVDSNEQHS